MRVWRLARRVVIYGALAFTLLILGLFTLLHTPWFKHYARDFVVRQSHSLLEGDLSIGKLDGNFLSGLVLDDVVIRQGEATPVRIRRLGVHYSVSQIARGNAILIDRLEIQGLTLSVARLPSGGLNIGSLFRKRAPSGKPRRTVDIRQIQLDDADFFGAQLFDQLFRVDVHDFFRKDFVQFLSVCNALLVRFEFIWQLQVQSLHQLIKLFVTSHHQ